MRKYLANSGGGVNEEETCAARVFKEARATLDQARLRQPFCLTVDCFDPHEPWSPPPKYVDMYKDPSYDGPNIGVTKYGFARNFSDAEIRHLHAIYAAEVTLTDVWLGHFMERFYELGLDENTVVLLLSDHGYLLGERGYTGKVPSQLHPELAQVPFVIVHPDDRAAGRTSTYFASTHDVGPTLLSLAGLDAPGWMEGTDLSPVLDGAQPARAARLPLRRHVQPLLHPHRRLGADRRQPRPGAPHVRPAQRPARVLRRPAKAPGRERGALRTVLDAAGGPLPYYE